MPRRRIARRVAEILRKEPCAAVSLNASYPHLRRATVPREIAVDHLELQVGIALKQTHFIVHRRGSGSGVSVEDRAPLDVEVTVRRAALDTGEDTAARAVVTATITGSVIGALVCP